MMRLASILLLPLLVSCETSHYKAVNATFKNGLIATYKMVEEPLVQWGGARTTNRADGSSTTTDYQVSFQHFMQFLGSLTTAISTGNIAQINAITQRMKDAGLNEQSIASIKAQAQLDALKNTPVKVEPGQSIYTPANGGFTAPTN